MYVNCEKFESVLDLMFDASVDYTFAKLFEEVHQLDSSSANW